MHAQTFLMTLQHARWAIAFTVLLVMAAGSPALAGDETSAKPITFQSVYGPNATLHPYGKPAPRFQWLPDGEHYLRIAQGWFQKVNVATGESTPFFDESLIGPKIRQQLAWGRGGGFDSAYESIWFQRDNDLHYRRLDGSFKCRLTHSAGREEMATFSPDGKFVAFVRNDDLYVVDVATQQERRFTTDGGGVIRNGKADWVYWEEVFGRQSRAFWFSGDSTQIAFLRFDDAPVSEYVMTDNLPSGQTVRRTRYPQAGSPNPLVTLGIASVREGTVRWVDLSQYPKEDRLIVRVGWQPDGETMYFYAQNRTQAWLDFNIVRPGSDVPVRLFRETTAAWVDDPGEPWFLEDGVFLLTSWRSGRRHLYRFDSEGTECRALTEGDWDVDQIQAVDESGGWVYVTGSKDSPLADNLYRVKIETGEIDRLTRGPGTHRISLAPGSRYFIDRSSTLTAPPQSTLHDVSGKQVRVLDQADATLLDEYRFGDQELIEIPARDGKRINGSLLKPADFDPNCRYPVWLSVYGGPHYPLVQNRFDRMHRLFDEVLATAGIVVLRVDPRSSARGGEGGAWTAFRQLGVAELRDLEDTVGWLTGQPWVADTRIGMGGHSYGGFLTAYAMTHSKLFACGIAGAPVTDWRNYDTIYTERYMDTPQNNPEGYHASSVVEAAGKLHGRLLILHGMQDDNVHLRNTTQLVHALQQADRDFEVMVYPRAKHGLHGRHYRRTMYEFILRNLRPDDRLP